MAPRGPESLFDPPSPDWQTMQFVQFKTKNSNYEFLLYPSSGEIRDRRHVKLPHQTLNIHGNSKVNLNCRHNDTAFPRPRYWKRQAHQNQNENGANWSATPYHKNFNRPVYICLLKRKWKRGGQINPSSPAPTGLSKAYSKDSFFKLKVCFPIIDNLYTIWILKV